MPARMRKSDPGVGGGRRLKIAFLIRALTVGGAERQLVELARGLRERGHDVLVIVFYPDGPLGEELVRAGVRLCSLDKRGRWETLGFLGRLLRLLRREAPDVLHGYLEVANILAVLVRPVLPRMRTVWGIRAANIDYRRYDRVMRASFWLLCRLARFPDRILVNSRAGREHHRRLGFPDARMRVVPNGIDTLRFRPDPEAGRRIRREWELEGDGVLVGIIGRLDPMKDHPTFLLAASRLMRQRPDVRFVCLGDGPPERADELRRLADELGLGHRIRWLPARSDMPAVYNALDIVCSSSLGEGFSNVLAEAMACGVPCVATDVGDSAWILGDTGVVVPPQDPEALAWGMEVALARRSAESSAAARRRIVEQFAVDRLISATEAELWVTD